jgi:O-antigen biosynthesis protein
VALFRRRRGGPLLDAAEYSAIAEFTRTGPAPLAKRDRHPSDPLQIAFVVPFFRRGSGGHATIAHLARGLETLGHRCSVWLNDPAGRHADQSDDEVDALFRLFFGDVGERVRRGFDGWDGADVAVATGWQTVHRTLLLEGCGARAYLVQDHEPEFYGASAERLWAEETYGLGLHAICASEWLAGVVRGRYGASASSFALGVDQSVYRPLPVHRRDDLVLFYCRAVTPRRAVPLGLLALEELHRRRPAVEIALFGDAGSVRAEFPFRDLGVLDEPALAHAYGSATVGLVLSLTNPSLVPTEMLACGLPVVDIASESMLTTFGTDGPIALAPPTPTAIADALETLLDDLELRATRAREGLTHTTPRTWPAAAAQVDAALRAGLGA